jgi:hypothetical protein
MTNLLVQPSEHPWAFGEDLSPGQLDGSEWHMDADAPNSPKSARVGFRESQ